MWLPFIVRRLHDIGLSGWWALLVLAANPFELKNIWLMQVMFGIEIELFSVPMMLLEAALLLFALVLFFWPGNKGTNKWGSPNNRLQSDAATPHA
jgi:uncharacterized membrane protein YhaH (DUF805 family)